jgi:type III restriction enzyme
MDLVPIAPIVTGKAQAATKWCTAATQHAAESGGKPWPYLLIFLLHFVI